MLYPMRTLMYVPGNRLNMIQKAPSYGADILVLDLEDAVPPSEKANARATVEGAIKGGVLAGSRVIIRINGLNTAESSLDLKAVIIPGVMGLRVPKVETAGELRELDRVVSDLERHSAMPEGTVRFFPIVESPLGILRAFEIASATPRVAAITVGSEDLATMLGTERSREGTELQYARQHVVMCAAAAKVAAIDTVYANVQDEEGLIAEARYIKQLGYAGKSAIHPKQVGPIHAVFAPTPEEIAHARQVVEAFEKAEAAGSGAVTVNGKMVDLPIVARARRVLARAGE